MPGAVFGWDLTAALALGDALGVPPAAAAELLSVVEPVMVEKLNEQMEASHVPRLAIYDSVVLAGIALALVDRFADVGAVVQHPV